LVQPVPLLQVVLHAVDTLVANSSNNVLRNGYEKVGAGGNTCLALTQPNSAAAAAAAEVDAFAAAASSDLST
jgi:hypothetical protein